MSKIATFKQFVADNKTGLATLATLALVGAGGTVTAGTTGTEFQPVWDIMTDWIDGFFGKMVSLAFVIVGLVAGMARGSIMGFAMGIGAALGFNVIPGIIDTVVSATLPAVSALPLL